MKIIHYVLLLSVLLSACATNPVSKQKEFVMMSEKEELQLGQQLAAEYARQLPLLPDEHPLSRYVDGVGQKLAQVSDRPQLFYDFHVVDDSTINAFALPGGHIYIHKGLLTHLNSEAELAAVLGHEIGHVTARHAVARYTQIQGYQLGMVLTSIFVPVPQALGTMADLMAQSFIMGYGRKQELQADELALKYAPAAGYDPYAVVSLLATLKRLEDIDKLERMDSGEKVPEYHGAFASHPETKRRIREAAARMQSVNGGIVGREALLHMLDGLPYGDSPKDGAMVGQRFIHPELGIQLAFPDNWVAKNTPEALTARVRKEKAYFMLTMKKLSKRQNAEAVLRSMFKPRYIHELRTGMLAGKPYARAWVRTSAPHVSRAWIDVSVRLDGPRAMIMSMWCPRDQRDQYAGQFQQIFQSFRRYDKARDGDVPRIALDRWKSGDSWQKLAQRSGQKLGRYTARRLAALNGMDVAAQPQPGTLIKIVR